jgi:hypothetical protein
MLTASAQLFVLAKPSTRRLRCVAGALVATLALVLAPAGCRKDEKPTPGSARATAAIPAPGINVLIVTVDTTRADRIECYGFAGVKTPNINRLAAEGARFEQCISSAPLTLPSHASIMTGSYQFVHGAIPTAIGLMAATILLVHERRLLWAIISIISLPLIVWALFEIVLRRPLP